jgi:hypothetical protein
MEDERGVLLSVEGLPTSPSFASRLDALTIRVQVLGLDRLQH